jgi:hypothetical protein
MARFVQYVPYGAVEALMFCRCSTAASTAAAGKATDEKGREGVLERCLDVQV